MWRTYRNRYTMGQTKKKTETETRRVSLSSLYDRLLIRLDMEIDSLQDTLQAVSPEKRLDFVTKTVPLLLKYRESGEGVTASWEEKWGD